MSVKLNTVPHTKMFDLSCARYYLATKSYERKLKDEFSQLIFNFLKKDNLLPIGTEI